MRYHLSLVFLVLLAVIVQQFIPTFTFLHGAQLLLVTLVFLCASVTVPTPVMLALAFLCGFLNDAENVIVATGAGDPDVYGRPEPSLRFGYSILLYGLIGYLMQGIQPLFREGRWWVPTVLAGLSVFVYLSIEYLLINFIRGGFVFGRETFLKIALSSGFAMFCSPVVFWALFRLADACGQPLRTHQPRKPAAPRTRAY
jgi:cell shape-determining protein MreD